MLGFLNGGLREVIAQNELGVRGQHRRAAFTIRNGVGAQAGAVGGKPQIETLALHEQIAQRRHALIAIARHVAQGAEQQGEVSLALLHLRQQILK